MALITSDSGQVRSLEHQNGPNYLGLRALLGAEGRAGRGRTGGARSHNMDYPLTRWPESPRIAVQCAPRASNGPNHLGLCALQEFRNKRGQFKPGHLRPRGASPPRVVADLLGDKATKLDGLALGWRKKADWRHLLVMSDGTVLGQSGRAAREGGLHGSLHEASLGSQLQPLWRIPAAAVS